MSTAAGTSPRYPGDMPFPGGGELLVVLVIVLVLFGGSKLPQLARNLGQAQREFKHGADSDESNSTGNKPSA